MVGLTTTRGGRAVARPASGGRGAVRPGRGGRRAGARRAWAVVARRQYPKAELPVAELFVRGGSTTQLVLITCGGAFDASARSYLDNIVVYATPSSTAR